MSVEREQLIRESFELERDYHFQFFRQHHWDEPEITAACPDPVAREELQREFWKQDSEKHYHDYRASVAGLNETQLKAHRDELAEMLIPEDQRDYPRLLREASRVPANDNVQGLAR